MPGRPDSSGFCAKFAFFSWFLYLLCVDILHIAISSLSFLSVKEKKLLEKNIDSLDSLALLSIQELSTIIGRSTGKASWNGGLCRAQAEKACAIMAAKGIHAVLHSDPAFPVMLKTIPDFPYAVFYRGSLEPFKRQCVSVVGTRKICRETAQAAFSFAQSAVQDGQTVVSGLAYGTDTFAHKGALSGGETGCTAAVLPCGIETVVPYGNRFLAAQIVRSGGCIASEYAPGIPAEPWRFVHRNRLVAALSSCTVVVHAPAGSGALITADFAADYSRDVMFHEAGLRAIAVETAGGCQGKKVRAERTCGRFLEEGAPVIKNYADFVTVKNDAPGTHVCKNKRQLELFKAQG